MSWLASFGVAIATGLLGMVVSGVVANLAVEWYRVSSFEGGSGYFVVGLALVGLIAGAVIGLGVARLLPDAGAVRALGTSAAVVVLLGAGIGGVSRLLADVPPTIDGNRLLLAFELRWPPGDTAVAAMTGRSYARLGAASGQSVRVWGDGVLLVEDARFADGRWIVPGAVEIFTARGTRLLDVGLGDSAPAGFVVDLPGHPGTKDRTWSDWLPQLGPGGSELPNGLSYRHRVVTTSEPLRQQAVGPFTVSTTVSYFFQGALNVAVSATSQFTITRDGRPIAGLDVVEAVAMIGGTRPALLVRTGEANATGQCQLLHDDGGSTTRTPLSECVPHITGQLLTADSGDWHASRRVAAPPGWLDRTTFKIPGLYRIQGGILDTRTLAFTASEPPDSPTPINGLAPISMSPDESSYAWFAHANDDEQQPVLCVTDWRSNSTYTVPIDRARMRYTEYTSLDPGWVAHHFAWERGDGGVTRLVPRAAFTPLPYRGDREIDGNGTMSSYYLKPGGTALRNAMVEAMVHELGAERMPDELDGYHQVVRYEGKLVKSSVVGSGGFVSIGMDFGTVDSDLMTRLADRLDALLATRRFDVHFHVDPPIEPPA